MKDHRVLWDSIRNSSGWPWALGAIKADPALMDLSGPNWSESVLHWAMLGSLEAVSELLPLRADLISRLDSQARAPLDWGMEKIYFMKDDASALGGLDSRGKAMADQARSCLMLGFNWMQAQGHEGPWTGDAGRFIQLALSAGELELALLGSASGARAGPELWLCGLAGRWEAPGDAARYLAELDARFGIGGDSLAFGLPLGLHAAQLWCAGEIDDDAFVKLHEAGARADQETADVSLESLYAASPKSSTAALDRILGRLGL